MPENKVIPSLNDGDVISFNDRNVSKCSRLRWTLNEYIRRLEQTLREHIKYHGFDIHYGKLLDWTNNGISCEVLRLGSHEWRSGKLKARIIFEFEPDEEDSQVSQSPLDDIRQSIQEKVED